MEDKDTVARCKRKPPMPVDTGWAWLVMLASFVNITVVISFNRALGLFVPELLSLFPGSASATTMTVGAAPMFFSLCNLLLPGVFMSRFEVRTLVVAGGLLSGISVTGMAFVDSLPSLALLFACMGFSHGMLFVPQTSLLGLYFQRRLAFATAFAYMGMAAAAIGSPAITKVLLENYGLRGTLLVFGAFTFHIVPMALIFRPPSAYRDVDLEVEVSGEKKDSGACGTQEDTLLRASPDMSQKITYVFYKDQMSDGDHKETTYEVGGRDCETDPLQNINKPYDNKDESADNNKMANYLRGVNQVNDSFSGASQMSSQRIHIITKNGLDEDFLEIHVDKLLGKNTPETNESEPLNNTLSSIEKNITPVNIPDSEYVASVTNGATNHHDQTIVKGGNTKTNSTNQSIPSKKRNDDKSAGWLSRGMAWFQSSVYSQPVAIILLIASALITHTQASSIYLPVLGQENGLDPSQLAYILTAVGVASLLSKLVIGYVADLSWCNTLYFVCSINMLLGVGLNLARFYQGFALMTCLATIIGAFSGLADYLLPSLVCEYLGKQYIGHIMSGFMLLNGMGMSIDHVMVGAIKDSTGWFYPSYNYMGSLVLLGVFLFIPLPFVVRLVERRAGHTLGKERDTGRVL